jgi:hypothetical protein
MIKNFDKNGLTFSKFFKFVKIKKSKLIIKSVVSIVILSVVFLLLKAISTKFKPYFKHFFAKCNYFIRRIYRLIKVRKRAALLLAVPFESDTVYIDPNPSVEEGINLLVIKEKATMGVKLLVEEYLPE